MFDEIKRYIKRIEYENGGIPIGVKIIFGLMILLGIKNLIFFKESFVKMIIEIVVLVMSLLFHELGHGYAAKFSGDKTAELGIKNLIFFKESFVKMIIEIVVLVMSLLFHELGHGYAAKFSGDKTAEHYGRLSLNPLNHLDPMGTILPIIMRIMGFPIFIGWAKPVPINYSNLKNGKVGEISVALAGVTVNFLLALISMIIFYSGIDFPPIFREILYKTTLINISLCAFNLIPIPPLDGSRVVASFLDTHRKIQIFSFDRFGFFIIMILSYTNILDKIMKFIMSGEIILIENILRLIYG